eukprot:GHVU01107402.1.p1 GENE.GHVU01107402.1~~GHVU01107402.1.p1  ORF type:complete len:228 (+),score=0.32 GHVU01107402.1:462-1145(+)
MYPSSSGSDASAYPRSWARTHARTLNCLMSTSFNRNRAAAAATKPRADYTTSHLPALQCNGGASWHPPVGVPLSLPPSLPPCVRAYTHPCMHGSEMTLITIMPASYHTIDCIRGACQPTHCGCMHVRCQHECMHAFIYLRKSEGSTIRVSTRSLSCKTPQAHLAGEVHIHTYTYTSEWPTETGTNRVIAYIIHVYTYVHRHQKSSTDTELTPQTQTEITEIHGCRNR